MASDRGKHRSGGFRRRARRTRLAIFVSLALSWLGAGAAAGQGAPRVRVAVPDSADLASIVAALEPHAWVELVSTDASADLRLESTPDGVALAAADGSRLATLASDDAAGVLGWAHRVLLGALANPHAPTSMAFEFRLGRADDASDAAPVRVVEPGTEIRWEFRNRSADPLHVAVFIVSPDRGVTLVHPFRGRAKAVPPGDAIDQSGDVSLPDGWRSTTDRFVALATLTALDATAFLSAERLTAGLSALGHGEWQTASHELRVRRELVAIADPAAGGNVLPAPVSPSDARPAGRAKPRPRPRTTRFGVYFDTNPELGAVQRRTAALRALCGRTGAACEVERLFPEGGFFELARTGRRMGEGRTQTVAAAFEQAYQIRSGLSALRVEPFLELEMPFLELEVPFAELEVPFAADDGSAATPAASDDAWHLRQLGARRAWRELRDRHARPVGREALGIRVAQVDTGFRAHPEIQHGAGGSAPLQHSASWDFVDGDADASDRPPARWPIDHPAHGTASASLIASPPGCQLSGQPGCVHGVAPGAQVAALRAHRSVVHFHAGRLARVIHAAASGGLPEPVDLLSVAMSGPPGWALWWSARLAEQRGLPIVAASGSDVATVLWPARFDSTLAIVATGPDCRPWPRSAKGPAVDVAAPGAGVWRATLDENGEAKNRPGSGNPFAAATASGAIALWLARWSGDGRLSARRADGSLTRALRSALRETAWVPGGAVPGDVACAAQPGGWDPDSGAGIVDAGSLLARPPRAGEARSRAAVSVRDLPLFRSLYADDAAAGRAGSDYRSLFGLGPAADLEAVAYLEAEVLHHYALSQAVSEALDRALARPTASGVFAEARGALLGEGLSRPLREALLQAAAASAKAAAPAP